MGYWVKEGETFTVDYQYSGSAPSSAPELWIVPIQAGKGDPERLGNQIVTLSPGINNIRAEHQGALYVAPRNQPTKGEISIHLSRGGSPMPTFELGKHTDKDWKAMVNAFPDAAYGQLVGKRMILAMPLELLKKNVDDPIAVMQLWDRIVTLAEQQYGLEKGNPRPHAETPFQYMFVTKPDNTGGYMSASSYWLGTNAGGVYEVASAAGLKKGWGPWHELGHHYQLPAMTWSGQTEVTVNLTSLYVQRALGEPSRLEPKVWDRVFAYLKQSERDYDKQSDLFVRVAMLWQLDLAFGKDFYARLGARYRLMPWKDMQLSDSQKKQTLILEASRVSGHDLAPFFEKWGLPAAQETKEKIASLGLRPLDKNIWENRDKDIKYSYSLAQQNVAGKVMVPNEVAAGTSFTAKVNVANRNGGKLTYHWHIPQGFSGPQSDSPEITLRAPKGVLQNSSALIPVTVSDGQQSMTLASYVRLKNSGPEISPAQAFDAMVLRREGKDKILQWDSAGRGTVGDIYAYENGYRRSRDYFRLKTSQYWYFPTDGSSNSAWEFLDSFDGSQYLSDEIAASPVADAGKNRVVVATSNVAFAYRLDGSQSQNGTTYRWEKASGPGSVRNADQAIAEAVIPKNTMGETVYRLTVTNDKDQADSATVKVTAIAPTVATSGPEVIEAGQNISWSAEANFTGDSSAPVKYRWQVKDSTGTTILGGDQRTLSLKSLAAGDYRITVRAETDHGARVADAPQKNLTVKGSVANRPPVAQIDGPATADFAQKVHLSAARSTDPDGDRLSFSWSVPAGITAQHSGSSLNFAAPAVKVDTPFEFKVTVSDGKASTFTKHVLTVKAKAEDDGSKYPAYEGGKIYKGGDIVSNRGKAYKCKPFPYSGWCGQAPAAYEPGRGWAWTDAWDEVK